jgi:hypothetical protein
MNKVYAIAALTALAGSAYAQQNPLPPSSATDGVVNQAIGLNAGATHWEADPGLGSYKFASDIDLDSPNMSSPDNRLGLNWSAGKPSTVASNIASIDAAGGTIRAIFTGESAGWVNDFGYTRSGNPTTGGLGNPNQSFTVYENIQAVTPGATISFGDHFDVTFDKSDDVSKFDFWLNAVGAFGPANPPPAPGGVGGIYTILNAANSIPYIAPGNVLWAQSPILVNTFVGLLADTTDGLADGYTNVPTWLVGIEDWRRDSSLVDNDFNDFVFGIQLFDVNGRPFGPVPEPSTYGLIGAAALLGLVGFRRFKSKK